MGAGRKFLSFVFPFYLFLCKDTDSYSEWAQRVGKADGLIRKST